MNGECEIGGIMGRKIPTQSEYEIIGKSARNGILHDGYKEIGNANKTVH